MNRGLLSNIGVVFVIAFTSFLLFNTHNAYALDPIDDCLTSLDDKVSPTFAEGNYSGTRFWNITWTGSECYYIGEASFDGHVWNNTGVYFGDTTNQYLFINRAYTAGAIYTGWIEFNVTAIQQNDINVSNVDVWAWLWSSDSVQRQRSMPIQPSISSNQSIWQNSRTGTLFWEGNPQSVCGGGSRWCELDLTALSWTNMENSLIAGNNYWALSLTDYAGGSAWDYWYSDDHASVVVPYIEIYYNAEYVAPPSSFVAGVLVDGYIGGLPNTISGNITEVDAHISYIYVSSVDRSIYINETYFSIAEYINPLGNAWVAVMLYSASNTVPISSTNPLKIIWSESITVENGTTNTPYIFYPKISTGSNKYIAIGLSVSQTMDINASDTNQTMYYYPTYAPVAIETLLSTSEKLGLYFTWSYITPLSLGTALTIPDGQIDILRHIDMLTSTIGVPSILVYGILFIVALMGMILSLTVVKKESGDSSPIPPIFLGVTAFGIASFFTISGLLPFEMLIFIIIVICALFAMFLSKIFLGDTE